MYNQHLDVILHLKNYDCRQQTTVAQSVTLSVEFIDNFIPSIIVADIFKY